MHLWSLTTRPDRRAPHTAAVPLLYGTASARKVATHDSSLHAGFAPSPYAGDLRTLQSGSHLADPDKNEVLLRDSGSQLQP